MIAGDEQVSVGDRHVHVPGLHRDAVAGGADRERGARGKQLRQAARMHADVLHHADRGGKRGGYPGEQPGQCGQPAARGPDGDDRVHRTTPFMELPPYAAEF